MSDTTRGRPGSPERGTRAGRSTRPERPRSPGSAPAVEEPTLEIDALIDERRVAIDGPRRRHQLAADQRLEAARRDRIAGGHRERQRQIARVGRRRAAGDRRAHVRERRGRRHLRAAGDRRVDGVAPRLAIARHYRPVTSARVSVASDA